MAIIPLFFAFNMVPTHLSVSTALRKVCWNQDIIAILALTSISAFSIDGQLDGKKFCRTVQSGGMMGQPAGTRLHCLSFKGGRATDNANTFFGNPPSSYTYTLHGTKLFNVDDNKNTGYVLKDRTLVMKETGRVLKLVK